jgi:hypothetical protein
MLTTFALLIAAHFVADYPLQGDFLATAKQKGPLRLWHLFGHSAIHGGAVGLVTGSLVLGLLETAAHMAIDELKTRGVTSFAMDQALHVVCKLLWIALLVTGAV